MKVIKSIFRFIAILFLISGSMPVFATIRGAPVYVKTVAQPNGTQKKYVRAFLKDRHVDFYSSMNRQRQQQQLFRVLERCKPHSVKVVAEDMQTYDGPNIQIKRGIQQWIDQDQENQSVFSHDPIFSTSLRICKGTPLACLVQTLRSQNMPCVNIEFRHLTNSFDNHKPEHCRQEMINNIMEQYNVIKTAYTKDNTVIPKNLYKQIERWMDTVFTIHNQKFSHDPLSKYELENIDELSDRLIDALMYYHIDRMEKEETEYGFFALGVVHIEGAGNIPNTLHPYSLDDYMAARGYTKAAHNEFFPFTQEQLQMSTYKHEINAWVVEHPRDIEADLAPFIPGNSYVFPTSHVTQQTNAATVKSSKEQNFANLEAQILALKQHSAAINQQYDEIEKDNAEIAAGIERLKQGTAQVNATVHQAQQSIAHTTVRARALARNQRRRATTKPGRTNRPQHRASATRTVRRVPRQQPSQKRRPTTKAVRATIAKKAAASRMHRTRRVVARRGNQRKVGRRII